MENSHEYLKRYIMPATGAQTPTPKLKPQHTKTSTSQNKKSTNMDPTLPIENTLKRKRDDDVDITTKVRCLERLGEIFPSFESRIHEPEFITHLTTMRNNLVFGRKSYPREGIVSLPYESYIQDGSQGLLDYIAQCVKTHVPVVPFLISEDRAFGKGHSFKYGSLFKIPEMTFQAQKDKTILEKKSEWMKFSGHNAMKYVEKNGTPLTNDDQGWTRLKSILKMIWKNPASASYKSSKVYNSTSCKTFSNDFDSVWRSIQISWIKPWSVALNVQSEHFKLEQGYQEINGEESAPKIPVTASGEYETIDLE